MDSPDTNSFPTTIQPHKKPDQSWRRRKANLVVSPSASLRPSAERRHAFACGFFGPTEVGPSGVVLVWVGFCRRIEVGRFRGRGLGLWVGLSGVLLNFGVVGGGVGVIRAGWTG
jgi:hypothetical protein